MSFYLIYSRSFMFHLIMMSIFMLSNSSCSNKWTGDEELTGNFEVIDIEYDTYYEIEPVSMHVEKFKYEFHTHGELDYLLDMTEVLFEGECVHVKELVNKQVSLSGCLIEGWSIVGCELAEIVEEEVGQSTEWTQLGEKNMLVVRINSADITIPQSVSKYENKIFNSGMGVGFEACSYGQLKFIPFTGTLAGTEVTNGIIDVTLSMNSESTEEGVQAMKNEASQLVFGGKSKSDKGVDFVMWCIPSDCPKGCAAYASVKGYDSWYFGKDKNHCITEAIQMHEIGHNLGMHHSGEGVDSYGDGSGMMGAGNKYPMCFNPAKNYYTGWYADRHAEWTEESGTQTYKLVGVAEYGMLQAGSDEIIVLKIGSMYVGYNRKVGINSATAEYGNMVLLTSQTAEDKLSSVVDALAEGDVYQKDGTRVEVLSLDKTNSPGIAVIEVSSYISCGDGVAVAGGATEDYCSSWCNDGVDSAGAQTGWGCAMESHDSYTCDCSQCNGCDQKMHYVGCGKPWSDTCKKLDNNGFDLFDDKTILTVICVSDTPQSSKWAYRGDQSKYDTHTCGARWKNMWWDADIEGRGCHTKNYYDAIDLCASFNARLPTIDELNDGCVIGADCSTGGKQVWSSHGVGMGDSYYASCAKPGTGICGHTQIRHKLMNVNVICVSDQEVAGWNHRRMSEDTCPTQWETIWWGGGCNKMTFEDAIAHCGSFGGRLPTVEELSLGCVSSSQCQDYNGQLVWSSEVVVASGSSTDDQAPPADNPTEGADDQEPITEPPTPTEPVVEDLDCIGEYQECTEACEPAADRVWIETQAVQGDGVMCPEPEDCEIGDGQCIPEIPVLFQTDGVESYWVDEGCKSTGNKVVGSFMEPTVRGPGVRCCHKTKRKCQTPYSCKEGDGYTYAEAVAACPKKYGSNYVLCSREELDSGKCCGKGGGCDTMPVWSTTPMSSEISTASEQLSTFEESLSGILNLFAAVGVFTLAYSAFGAAKNYYYPKDYKNIEDVHNITL